MLNGITGLRTHAKKMDVISNDVANVNTIGYKQSECTFKETLVDTIRTPAAGTPGMQIGMGSAVSQITRNWSDGILMQTGLSSNIGITGEGFFVLKEPDAAAGTVTFTRSGDFVHDYDEATGETYLITSDGYRLQGIMDANPDATGLTPADLTDIILPENTTSYSIALDGTVRASVLGGTPTVIGMVPLTRFANNYGLENVGNNMFRETDAAGIQAMSNPGTQGTGQVFQGYLENSNVDLSQEFTEMIVTQRGFQANSRSITTADEMLQEVLALKR
jgi:flagellar hook protein FlgE